MVCDPGPVSTPLVSVVIVNYNGQQHLGNCMASLIAQSYCCFEIIVVDNGSTDDSVSFLRSDYPEVKIIEAGQNLGFGAGNNLGIQHSRGDYIVFTNYDVEFDRGWLRNLVSAAQDDEAVGLVAPKIMLFSQRDLVQTCGLAFQYTGHAFSQGLGSPSGEFCKSEEIGSVSGCAFLIKRCVLEQVGCFDEVFHKFSDEFFYSSLEDVDLSWRAQLAGYRIRFEPRAVMYHKYKQKPLTPLRYYYLECGRYYTLLKNYDLVTLIVLLPAFLVSEALIWAYVLLKGWAFVTEKMKSYTWVWRQRQYILAARAKVQALRRVSDREILRRFQAETNIRHVQWPSWLRRIVETPVNLFFRLYRSFALFLLTCADNLATHGVQ